MMQEYNESYVLLPAGIRVRLRLTSNKLSLKNQTNLKRTLSELSDTLLEIARSDSSCEITISAGVHQKYDVSWLGMSGPSPALNVDWPSLSTSEASQEPNEEK